MRGGGGHGLCVGRVPDPLFPAQRLAPVRLVLPDRRGRGAGSPPLRRWSHEDLALVLAVVFIVCAILSMHASVRSQHVTRARLLERQGRTSKHPFLYLVLAVLSLIWLRFQSAQPATLNRPSHVAADGSVAMVDVGAKARHRAHGARLRAACGCRPPRPRRCATRRCPRATRSSPRRSRASSRPSGPAS